jgi:iron complex transport system substrate-binding protein
MTRVWRVVGTAPIDKSFLLLFFKKEVLLFLAFALLSLPAGATRVVSLNLCTDTLLVQLAPEQIAALSPLARDPALSVVAAPAARLPWVRPDAEAVLRLRPDLVLAGEYGAQAAVGLLRERGVRVVAIPEPTDFAGITTEVQAAAGALGVPARGAEMLARMRARLAAVRPRRGGRAVFWQAHGFTAGPGSFGDAVLRAAGFSDAGTGAVVGAEVMAVHPPDVLVVASAPEYPSLATDLLMHPAVGGVRRVKVPPALLACTGPWSVGAVEVLAR